MDDGRPALDANKLRAMGIEHEMLTDDDELLEVVTMLLQIGVELSEMVDVDITTLQAPRLIRPNATINPEKIFDPAESETDFRARAAVALGFRIDEDMQLLTPEEVEAIKFFNEMRDLVGDDETLALLRVLGSSMARVARSVITMLRLNYETPIVEADGNIADLTRAYRDITVEMMPRFLSAVAAVLRRHVAVLSIAPTQWNVDGSHAATIEQSAVGFVDMVGFTSFTEQANLEEFMDALMRFESQAQEIIVNNGGTLVKLIGDEVMFVAPTAASAVEIARRLAQVDLGEGPTSVRIGLSCGDVVAVGGDYYGTVVNIAARAVRHADPNTIVATAAVASGAHAAMRFESIGPRELRGIADPVELFRLVV